MTEDEALAQPIEILLVEDNPGDVYLTMDLLERSRITNRISTVADGEEALRFVRREGSYAEAPRPDLILLDLNLPKKDGRSGLEEIKSDPQFRAIPVIVLTSSEAVSDVVRSYETYANSHVTKPISLEAFMHVIRSIESFWLSVVKLPRGKNLDRA